GGSYQFSKVTPLKNGERYNQDVYEAWAVEKIMAKEKLNRDVMYRVLKLLWFTMDEFSFVALNEDVILVKFENIEGGGWRPAPPRAMKLLCWNCRGLGNPMTVRELKQLIIANNPDIVFLCETKMLSKNFTRIRNICRLDGCLAISSVGYSKGLVMLWKNDIDVEYWIVEGDFNAIIDEAKKEGGRRKPRATMEKFRDVLEDLALVDLKIDRGWFTWVNNHEGNKL
ncbi:hypothetical protein Gorai_007794, partial [Gossypium raimondii]|nr:hypothetical protein [Gossypium raimondii]